VANCYPVDRLLTPRSGTLLFDRLVGGTDSMTISFIGETLEYGRELGAQVVDHRPMGWSYEQTEILAGEFNPPDYVPNLTQDAIRDLLARFPERYRKLLDIWSPLP
jgi:hypothetical protein